jgi:hypothetical protein
LALTITFDAYLDSTWLCCVKSCADAVPHRPTDERAVADYLKRRLRN